MKKILVIDDSSSIRKSIGRILAFEDIETVEAEDGLEGVEKAKKLLPDLIICDILMPGLDGWGVLKELGEDPNTNAIPFIFLTGRATEETVRHGMNVGADDFLTKPFSREQLLAAIKTRLKKQETLSERAERRLAELRENITFALPHEFRTPLSLILGFSALLEQDYQKMDGGEIGNIAATIHKSAKRLERLIQNFLYYSELEVLAADPKRMNSFREGRTQVNEDLLRSLLSKNKWGSVDPPLVNFMVQESRVCINLEHLEKIMDELMDNAIKFSEKGCLIHLEAAPNGDAYAISLRNRGREFPPEQIARIGAFMQFERKLYEQQGSGIGLAIVQQLLKIYKGRLNIESAPGEETTVRVLLKKDPAS